MRVILGDAGKFDEVILWQAVTYIVLPQLVLQVQRDLEGKFKKKYPLFEPNNLFAIVLNFHLL